MGRQLRERKAVTYNEDVLYMEATAAQTTDSKALLKFAYKGIDNTANLSAAATEQGQGPAKKRSLRTRRSKYEYCMLQLTPVCIYRPLEICLCCIPGLLGRNHCSCTQQVCWNPSRVLV